MTEEKKKDLAARFIKSAATSLIGLGVIGFSFYKYYKGEATLEELLASIAAGVVLMGIKEAGK